MGEKELSARIDALEERLTYQDETIEQLNATITAQWKQIDALTRQLAGVERTPAGSRGQRPGPCERAAAALLEAHREVGRQRNDRDHDRAPDDWRDLL